MKKVALALATVAAATAFAPEASAVPVFARQTGMACSACHFQHFPLLNGFGRAFKSAGFTMMGAQGKVEGDNEGVKLDIPDRLNMGVLTTAYWQNEDQARGGLNPQDQARLGFPSSGGELSIFYGGRVSEFAGFLSELGLTGAGGAAATGSAKLALLFPVADMRAGFVTYSGGQGASYSFETLNTGASDVHKMMGNPGANTQHTAAAYAGSYLGTRTAATGVSVVANNSMGFVNIGKFVVQGSGTGNINDLPLVYARAVANLDAAGWDIGVGVQHFHGDQSSTITPTATAQPTYQANLIDAQAQGEVAGMSTGLYVSYGSAPANGAGNIFAGGNGFLKTNAGVTAATQADTTVAGRAAAASGVAVSPAKQNQLTGLYNVIARTDTAVTTLNIAASVEVVHGATVQAAMRMAKLNYADTQGVGAANIGAYSFTDNAIMLGATYDIMMNVALGLNYTTQSGTSWDALATPVGKTMTTVVLEALF